jgi:hypothetical protein
MKMDLQLAKLGIFDFEPNRASAVKRLIAGSEDAVWYLSDTGLTWASRNPKPECSLSKAMFDSGWCLLKYDGLADSMAIENGFDIKKTPQHSFSFAMLTLTHHALERWEERCAGLLPSIREFQQVTNNHSADKVLKNERADGEFFIPVAAGALVGIHQSTPSRYDTISEVKRTTFSGMYQWCEAKRRWVGEFPRLKVNSIVTTFLGWDELQRGGAYNSVDWYKVQMELANSNNELTKMIYGE